MVRINPHTQWIHYRTRSVGCSRSYYHVTKHRPNRLYRHHDLYTSTTFRWVRLAYYNISISNSVRLSKLAVPSEINSLFSGHPGHSNIDPTITPQPPEHHIVKAIGKVWFRGDTGLCSVPLIKERRGFCAVFEPIGEIFGESDLGVRTSFPFHSPSTLTPFLQLNPIGAFSLRGHFGVTSPSDAVIIHKHVHSRKSIGMHWSCWALGNEVFMQDLHRLREACLGGGIVDEMFGTSGD